jgi:hypothetical protein
MAGNQRAKVITVAVLFLTAGGYSYWKYKSLQPSAAINNGVTGEFQRPSDNQRKDFMEQAAVYAELSPEQMKQLQELREKAGDDPRAMITSGSQILTPEQRQKMRQFFMSRVDAKAQKAMGADEFQRFKTKREEMIQRWRNNGGRGPGGPGGPARPGGNTGGGTVAPARPSA